MLRPVDRATFQKVEDAVPEHPNRIREERQKGSAYYMQRAVFDVTGNLVALDMLNGGYYADTSLIGRSFNPAVSVVIHGPSNQLLNQRIRELGTQRDFNGLLSLARCMAKQIDMDGAAIALAGE